MTHTSNGVRLPANCRVISISLPADVNGVIALNDLGGTDIYLNASLGPEARAAALRHELDHYYRGDLLSEADIRDIERDSTIFAMNGEPVPHPTPVFAPKELKRIGLGLYMPVGSGLARACDMLRTLCASLEDACRTFDVMQRPPLLSVERLLEPCRMLYDDPAPAIAFVAWQAPSRSAELPAVMQFSCGDLEGALYFARNARPHDAVAVWTIDAPPRTFRIVADLRPFNGTLQVAGITREVDRNTVRIY